MLILTQNLRAGACCFNAARMGLSPPRAVHTMRRSGCSLVEVLFALVLFTIGALSLAGSSAMVLRRLSTSHASITAAAAAASRLAFLNSTPCAALANGSAQVVPGLMESWSVERAGNAHARVHVTMHFEPNAHAENFRSTISCR